MSYKNEAAWLHSKQERPLLIASAPYTPPGPGQVVVKNGAIAVNPIDWQKQILGDVLLSYIKYPFILGGDIAGTVVEVGPEVKRFQVNDRVVAAALAIAPASGNPIEGAYQHYTVVREHMASPLPDHISFEQACVIPLTLCTAAYGLFHPDFLALDMPPSVPRTPANDGDGARPVRAVIITGGSSSVGANAVQLAFAAGYEVLSTSSPRNFGFVRGLGAAHVFDYHSKTVADDMLSALHGRTLVGAYAIGDGSVDLCTTVLGRHPDCTHKFIAMAGGSPVGDKLQSFYGVTVKFIDLKDACEPDGHVARIYKEYLPRALADGSFVPAPDAKVVGKGLDRLQEAMDIQMRGVSAQKIVVSL